MSKGRNTGRLDNQKELATGHREHRYKYTGDKMCDTWRGMEASTKTVETSGQRSSTSD
jgi:hypothetical protein